MTAKDCVWMHTNRAIRLAINLLGTTVQQLVSKTSHGCPGCYSLSSVREKLLPGHPCDRCAAGRAAHHAAGRPASLLGASDKVPLQLLLLAARCLACAR